MHSVFECSQTTVTACHQIRHRLLRSSSYSSFSRLPYPALYFVFPLSDDGLGLFSTLLADNDNRLALVAQFAPHLVLFFALFFSGLFREGGQPILYINQIFTCWPLKWLVDNPRLYSQCIIAPIVIDTLRAKVATVEDGIDDDGERPFFFIRHASEKRNGLLGP